MTTIAYKDGVIATDGQVTAGETIVSLNAEKAYEHDGVYFFLCGSETDIQEIIRAWPDGKLNKNNFAGGFAVNQGVLFGLCQDEGRCRAWEHLVDASFAYGSGSPFAMGAMDAGLTAEASIEVAANRDLSTGGTIRSYCAKTGKQLS